MLSLLRIKNFAVVEELEVEFGSGLNILTGETGAGKSILLKAIGLLSGQRSSSDIVRTGKERCEVEGVVTLSKEQRQRIADLEERLGLSFDGDELIVKRTVDRSGKGRVYLNNSLATQGALQELGQYLFDITSQHEHQMLLDSRHHREVLDQFGISAKLLQEVGEKYREFAKAEERLNTFLRDLAQQNVFSERLKAEVEELGKAALKSQERAELDAEAQKLANVEMLGSGASEVLQRLEEEQEGILVQLQRAEMGLERCAKFDPALKETVDLISSALVQVSEARINLSEYGNALEYSPDRLEQIRERIAELARLERKYEKPVDELIEYFTKIRAELEELESGELSEEKLQAEVDRLREQLQKVEKKLTAERKKKGQELSALVQKELAQLNLARARFEVRILPQPSSLYGADKIEFFFSANPGQELNSISKVASGGELSRLLLILKTLTGAQAQAGVQVFDEVDVGVSGAVAQAVGEKLQAVAKKAQVLVVTHAPQIAALGEQHYLISKSASADSTSSTVRLLNKKERVAEVARMLAGKKVSANFEGSAKELLKLQGNS